MKTKIVLRKNNRVEIDQVEYDKRLKLEPYKDFIEKVQAYFDKHGIKVLL